jgi:hypothetical protein
MVPRHTHKQHHKLHQWMKEGCERLGIGRSARDKRPLTEDHRVGGKQGGEGRILDRAADRAPQHLLEQVDVGDEARVLADLGEVDEGLTAIRARLRQGRKRLAALRSRDREFGGSKRH